MILLLLLLIHPSYGRFVNSPIVHVSDTLKIKCDALPYRTAYIGTRCYFAVAREVPYAEAAAQCSSVLRGAQIATGTPTKIFDTMMIDKSKYHTDEGRGIKQTICVYDAKYKCDVGTQSTVFPGKCIVRDGEQKSYKDALRFCETFGMEVPTVENRVENRMITGAIDKEPVWIRNDYLGATTHKWDRTKYYSHYGTCDRESSNRIYAGWQHYGAKTDWKMSSVIDKSGLWGNDCDWPSYLRDVVCVKDATNAFTRAKNLCGNGESDSGVCEWKGPADACAHIIDLYNRTFDFPMPDFPKQSFREITLCNPPFSSPVSDLGVKVIVRKGCMFRGFMHPRAGAANQENLVLDYRTHGTWRIPCYFTGELAIIGDGMSRSQCFCDPTEATLNGHEPTAPAKKKCIDHHEFDEDTQQCEWKLESKYCAELITHDGRRQLLEMPNWPANRRYDVDHWKNEAKRAEDFHFKVTDIIVRQHCWATLYYWGYEDVMTLPTAGYGKHQVASFYNSLRAQPDHGTHRFVCECYK